MSSTYQLGQTIVWRFVTRNTAGNPADLGTGPTAIPTRPDGTTTSATITRNGVGDYTITVTSDMVGRWLCTFDGGGDNSGGTPFTDVADVWPADPRMLISLADARATLDVRAANTAPDEELRALIVAATIIVEHEVGPVLTATHTETRDGKWRTGIALHHKPGSISTVVEDGIALDAGDDYTLGEGAVLWRAPLGSTWSGLGRGNVVITYPVGGQAVSQAVIEAGRRLVAHLYGWQQAPRPAFGGQPEISESTGGMVYRAGYAVPNAVIEILAPVKATNRQEGVA